MAQTSMIIIMMILIKYGYMFGDGDWGNHEGLEILAQQGQGIHPVFLAMVQSLGRSIEDLVVSYNGGTPKLW